MELQLNELDVPQSDKLGLAFPISDPKTYAALADAGFGAVRLGVSWQLIEASDDAWNWAGLDSRIKALTDAGIKPLLTFYSDAVWATSPGDNDAKNLLPNDMAEWAEFVGATAARYGSLVDDYQVANEFSSINNRSGGWASTSEALVTYVNTAYDAVKAADPQSTFVMGGVASLVADMALVNLDRATFEPSQPISATSSMTYTVKELRSAEADALIAERLLIPLQQARYDQAAVHLYGDRTLDALRIELISDLSGGRPVIVTESGAPTYDGTTTPTGVDYFATSALSDLGAIAAGAETVYWFQDYITGSTYYNQLIALRDENGNPKPSLWAKKLLAIYLTDDAKVTTAAEGIYHVASPTGGDALMGMGSSFAASDLYGAFGTNDVWVLEDPSTGGMRLLSPGERPADSDFVVTDNGWLERFVGGGDQNPVPTPIPEPTPEPTPTPEPIPEPIPEPTPTPEPAPTPIEEPIPEPVYITVQTGSVGIEFAKRSLLQTEVSQTVDGKVVATNVYSGQKKVSSISLDQLDITLSAAAPGTSAALCWKTGRFGVISGNESKADAQQIDGNERLIIEFDRLLAKGDFQSLSLTAWDAANGETAVFSAYHNGILVASGEETFASGSVSFDPGVTFDRLEIGAGAYDAFALRGIEVDLFGLQLA